MTTILKDLPGKRVDAYLKLHGHLPSSNQLDCIHCVREVRDDWCAEATRLRDELAASPPFDPALALLRELVRLQDLRTRHD